MAKNGTNWRPGRPLIFFPGLEVKNRDCPGKSGTDGHLMLDTLTLPVKAVFTRDDIELVVCVQMLLMQQMMQVVTQPSPVKAVFTRDDIELVVCVQMLLMQQMMQVATQPSPVKAVFTRDDIELAAVVLLQHLIASCSTAVSRASEDLPRPPCEALEDDVQHRPSSSSDAPPVVAALGVEDDDVFKPVATSSHPAHRRRETSAVRPPLPAVIQLMDMGFARRKAEAAMKHLGMSLPVVTIEPHGQVYRDSS